MKAKFATRCRRCGGSIRPGDQMALADGDWCHDPALFPECPTHAHRWDAAHRGQRRCTWPRCRAWQFTVSADGWRDSMSLRAFAEKWLPVVSGTDPTDMMTVKVAYPFEWNCYETWKAVWRVRFDFTDVAGRTQHGLGTRIDVMNGWQSKYHEDFCRIDFDAECYYTERTGRAYDIGDNAYGAMREIIQSPVGIKQPEPPTLTLVSPVREGARDGGA